MLLKRHTLVPSAKLHFMTLKGLGKQCQLLRRAIPQLAESRHVVGDAKASCLRCWKAGCPNFGNRTRWRRMHVVLLLFRPLPNVGMQNFGMWGMYDLAKAYRNMQKSIANRRVEDWEASNGRTKDTTRLFHGPWHNPVGEHICAQPFRMWNSIHFHPFLQVSQIFQRCTSDANKQDFENNLNLTCQAQSPPKTIGILTKVLSTSGPNLVVLAWTGDKLLCGQAQNGVNFDFEVKFDLEGQSQSPPKTIRILIKVFYTYAPNLVVLAWTGDELSRGQTWWQTDGLTDSQTQATTIPGGQYWPQVKIQWSEHYMNDD